MTDSKGSKAEEDIAAEDHQAQSRKGRGGDGEYVGRTAADDAIDAGETGAEARSREQ